MIAVRPPLPHDLPLLADLCTQLGYPSTAEDVERRLQSILPKADHAVFVAEAEGRLAGWIHVYACPTVESDLYAEIGGLVVDESRRGLGVGKALLAEAEEWARERGIAEVRVRSNVIRKEAHKFYEARGYENIKAQFTFLKRLLPCPRSVLQ